MFELNLSNFIFSVSDWLEHLERDNIFAKLLLLNYSQVPSNCKDRFGRSYDQGARGALGRV